MSDPQHDDALARAVFAGLVPSAPAASDDERERARLARGMRATMPIVLAGAMTVSMHLTGPVEPVAAQAKKPAKPPTVTTPPARAAAPVTTTIASSTGVPATYKVKAGDTVSGIAARYGLSTAAVLSLNGLGWKSLIFPGQVLKLTKPATTPAPPKKPAPSSSAGTTYTIKKGDTISGIAARHKVSTQKVLDANGLGWSTIIYPGQRIVIPGTSAPAPKPADPKPAPKPAEPAPPPAADDEPTLDPDEVADVTPVDPEPEPAPSAPPAPFYHVVVSGDTVSGIAARYKVSTQKVLDANGLGWSSIIRPGQKILIPGKAGTAPAGSTITPLTSEMKRNAQIIVDVGRSLGVPDRGIVIALAAAMQESSLRNIDYGDRDSVGLFQQRPSTGWGTVAQLTTPEHAAKLFYGGPKNPNKGKTRGLLDIPNWQSMTVTQAAQAVQISAYPNAYAKWEESAWAWLAQLG